MMSERKTAVTVTERTWRRLNARKRPGESFDDVVDRLIKENTDDIDFEIASDSDNDTE
jgi:predicted CopG family antitoxin